MQASTKNFILYAEDDHDDLDLVQQAFSRYKNIEIVHANNGLEALDFLKSIEEEEKMPCLILLDINMPVMDGKQALEKIKGNKRYENVPVIMFTTSSSESDKNFAMEMGADFITKPLNYSEVEDLAIEFASRCNIELIKN
jgi:DNA-binding response OmpR family regulator